MKKYIEPAVELFTVSATDDIIRTSGLTRKASGTGDAVSMNDFDVI